MTATRGQLQRNATAYAPATQRRVRAHTRRATLQRTTLCRVAAATATPNQTTIAVRDAATPEEVRLAACLRVDTFYPYSPADGILAIGPRFAEEKQKWLSRRRNAEVNRDGHLRALGMQVRTLVAVCEDAGYCDNVVVDEEKEVDGGSVLGTCDVHFGYSLPGEPLFGDKPEPEDVEGTEAEASASGRVMWLSSRGLGPRYASTSDAGGEAGRPSAMSPRIPEHALKHRRAYVFNLCVSESARRRGVGLSLLREAESVAASLGVEFLYVHVEAHNVGAIALYRRGGYSYEKEETEDVARRLRRPRRKLLRRELTLQ